MIDGWETSGDLEWVNAWFLVLFHVHISWTFHEHQGERTGHKTEALSKPSTEKKKKKEPLELLDHVWDGPFFHSIDLGLVHSYTIIIDDISLKGHWGT